MFERDGYIRVRRRNKVNEQRTTRLAAFASLSVSFSRCSTRTLNHNDYRRGKYSGTATLLVVSLMVQTRRIGQRRIERTRDLRMEQTTERTHPRQRRGTADCGKYTPVSCGSWISGPRSRFDRQAGRQAGRKEGSLLVVTRTAELHATK